MTNPGTSQQKPQPFFSKIDILISVGMGIISFCLYLRTMLPGLVPNDGAEFQTLAYTLGHAHTPGYSVFLLLARVFTFIPFGEVAYRVNLFAAFMGGIAIALLFLVGKLLSGSRWGGGLGACALAGSMTFWSQAVIPEVYTTAAVFSTAILLMVFLWDKTHTAVYLFIAGLLGGMGIGVHGSVILLAPAIGLFLLLNIKEVKRFWKPAVAGAVIGIVVLGAAFLYMDIHNTPASIMNTYQASISRWDMTPDQLNTVTGRFAFLIFAQQWRSAMFADPATVVPENFAQLIKFMWQDFSLPVHMIILVGFISLLMRREKLGLLLVSAIVFHLIYSLNYRIGDIYIFFISLYIYLMAFASEGAALILNAAARFKANSSGVFRGGIGILFILLAVFPYASTRIDSLKAGEVRFEFMGLPPNEELKTWHEMVLFNTKDLPENAVVLMNWDNLYGYTYAANVDLKRSDLLFLEAYPYATKSKMADTLFDYLREKMTQGRPVFALERYDELSRGGFSLIPRSIGVAEMYQVELR